MLARHVQLSAEARISERMRQVIHSNEEALLMNFNLGVTMGQEQLMGYPNVLIEEATRVYKEQLEIYNALSATSIDAT